MPNWNWNVGANIVYGVPIKITHIATNHRLHSHDMKYPGGSRQQQVTCFQGHDDNDWWEFKGPHGRNDHSHDGRPVMAGDIVRLEHCATQRNLHSHKIASHAAGGQHEVSCYEKNERGDGNDNWRVECTGPLNMNESFKLIHVATNCALHSHNIKYRFIGQNEVTGFSGRDQNDCWKVTEFARQGGGHGGHHGGGGGGGGGRGGRFNRSPVQFGAKLRLKHKNTNHHLHSHNIKYPGGSRQQQVTCFSGKDDNDFWEFQSPHGQPAESYQGRFVRNGDVVRLRHVGTRRCLHSHLIVAHTNPGPNQFEVSCYDEKPQGDQNDNWIVECNGRLNPGEPFRLVHQQLKASLHSHQRQYSFINQQEVTVRGPMKDDNDFFMVIDAHNVAPHQSQMQGFNIGMGAVVGAMAGMAVGAAVASAQQPPQAYPQPSYPQQAPQPGYPPQQQPSYPPQQQPGYPPQQQPGYPPQQQPGYPPQQAPQPGYPPQQAPQPGYPPQQAPQPGYPPQQQPGYPPQQGYAPPPAQPMAPPSGQPDLPPAGANIHIVSMTTQRNVRIHGDGRVDASGGNGQWAKFTVAPNNGFLRLQNHGNRGHYLAVRKQRVDKGPGGPACELAIVPLAPGVFTIAHAHGNGNLAFDQSGNPLPPAMYADPRAHFSYRMC